MKTRPDMVVDSKYVQDKLSRTISAMAAGTLLLKDRFEKGDTADLTVRGLTGLTEIASQVVGNRNTEGPLQYFMALGMMRLVAQELIAEIEKIEAEWSEEAAG